MKGDGVSLRELGDRQHRALVRVLERVRAEYRARGALLAEACGRPLAAAGHGCETDPDGFASLAASAVAASRSLAGMLGEAGTSLCLQRGGRDVVRLEPAGDLVIALVLDAESPQGLEGVRARLRLQRALADIRSILAQPQTNRDLDAIEAGELDALLGPIAASAE
jgi:predicted regulator of Ras-like GTPase activity (Roadblock/LC7/MglB family)